jgi:drug/metabolite transporter (DMT)-like permease
VKWSATPGAVVAFWRMAAAVLVWWLIARASGARVTLDSMRRCLVPGILFGVNLATFFTAVTRTSIAHAEFIGAMTPIVLLPAGALVFGERVAVRSLGWGAVAVAGVAIVLFAGPTGGTASLSGDLIVVVAMFLWASYLLSVKRVRSTMDVAQFLGSVMPVGMLAVVPIALISGGVTDISGRGWVAVALLLVLTGVGAHGFIVYAQRHVPVGTISVLQVAQPAIAVVWAYLILGERIRAPQVAGMVLVIGGLAAFVISSERSRRPLNR